MPKIPCFVLVNLSIPKNPHFNLLENLNLDFLYSEYGRGERRGTKRIYEWDTELTHK